MKNQSFQHNVVSILGAGNMGGAIVDGLLSGTQPPKAVYVTTLDENKQKEFKQKDIPVLQNNTEAVAQSHIIILSVKPQDMRSLLQEISDSVTAEHLIISIAAGLPITFFESFLGKNIPIIRVMPNLCAQVGASMSVWVGNQAVQDSHKDLAKVIFRSVGNEIELTSEDQINPLTALSGSGPAYIFYLAELFVSHAQKAGLSEKDAHTLTMQTFQGSVQLMSQSQSNSAELRTNVTSKGGTTEAALNTFYQKDLEGIFSHAVQAASERARQLESSS